MKFDSSCLLSYALDFTSFLLQKTHYKSQIRAVILFGSVAREEAGRESDIDLFIDTIRDDVKIELDCNEIVERFLHSTKYTNYWKPLGIENEIKLAVGVLDDWDDLKPSVAANGIVLFGKYGLITSDGKQVTFFVWENITPNSKRVLFNKQVLGYKQYGRFYEGLLQKYKGERLGKGCIMVPLESATVFLKLFRKYKIAVKIKKMREYA